MSISEFISHNSAVLTLFVAAIGILLSLGFGGVLQWYHKICFEYRSNRDVAMTILVDRYVQRASSHYLAIKRGLKEKGITVEESYKQPEIRELIQCLAGDLSDKNRVSSLFNWLFRLSWLAFVLIWIMIVLLIAVVLIRYFGGPIWSFNLLFILFCLCLLAFISALSVMLVLDNKYFQLVNSIVKPEGS